MQPSVNKRLSPPFHGAFEFRSPSVRCTARQIGACREASQRRLLRRSGWAYQHEKPPGEAEDGSLTRSPAGLNVSATCVAKKVNQKFGLRLTVKNGWRRGEEWPAGRWIFKFVLLQIVLFLFVPTCPINIIEIIIYTCYNTNRNIYSSIYNIIVTSIWTQEIHRKTVQPQDRPRHNRSRHPHHARNCHHPPSP